ncbi:MAG: ABC transporter ATP-binding protein [Bacteroidetes bacterium]|nr:ABC transporter ATP-binding protein [Bacteroidota bacterium]
MSFDYKVSGKAFDLSVLRRVLGLVSHHKRILYLSIFLTLAAAIVSPSVPFTVQYVIDHFIQKHDVSGLVKYSMIVAVLLILQALISYTQGYQTAWLGQQAILNLRNYIFNKIVNFRLRVYDKTAVGTMITRTISDVEAVADIFSEGLIQIIGDSLQIIVILCFMFYSDWRLSLVSLSILPPLLLAAYIFKEKIKSSFQEVRTQIGKLNSFLQEHITGMFVVQVFNREEEEMKRFVAINKLHRDANIRSVLYYSVFFPVIEILSAISIALVVWYGSSHVIAGDLSFGVVVAFIMYLNLLFRPIRQIADKFNTLQMGIVASDRIFKVLDMEDSIPETGTSKTPIKGEVEFKNVWFAYNEEDYVLKDVSFKVPDGEMLAIVGHTGSGKSSIINLVNRLYTYQRGNILIDGKNVEDFDFTHLRKNIAVVLQDVFLFSDTILNNIRLYNTAISEAEIINAAKLIGVHDFIMSLPDAYNYQVQERGATLSSGQRQLISFIRAILQQPRILILDEATSSVDPETEELLQHATQVLLQGRTSIVVAHRLSTIQHANAIILMDKGELKEAGTHAQLLSNNGKYRQLYDLQFSELVL